MITEGLILIFVVLVEGLLDLLPRMDVPDLLRPGGGLQSGIGQIAQYVGPWGGWVPLTSLSMVSSMLLVMLTWVFGAQIVRAIISIFSGGGGNTAQGGK